MAANPHIARLWLITKREMRVAAIAQSLGILIAVVAVIVWSYL
jgi:hypothetical protein